MTLFYHKKRYFATSKRVPKRAPLNFYFYTYIFIHKLFKFLAI